LERRRDPRDARRTALGLTGQGHALDRPAQGTVEDAVERLLETTPPRAIATVARVIARLTQLLGEELRE
jgi:MarR family transcriptional regulator, organic hydroperoxide resistance regulator